MIEKRHYRDPQDTLRSICRLPPQMIRGNIVDQPRNINEIREEDCGRCATITRQRWHKALLSKVKPQQARHYTREGEPMTMCGRSTQDLTTPPEEPPGRRELIQEHDCRTCVKMLNSRWEISRKPPKLPLEHIRKPDDLMTVLCGRRIDSLERYPAQYPAELPDQPSGQCRICRRHWGRRERRPPLGGQWQ